MGHLYLSVDLHLITKYVSASKEKGTGNTTHTQMKHTWLAGGGVGMAQHDLSVSHNFSTISLPTTGMTSSDDKPEYI